MANAMRTERLIHENVWTVMETLGKSSGVPHFGMNSASLAWLDGHLDRLHEDEGIDPLSTEVTVDLIGSFLGECIIECYGGAWDYLEGQLCIRVLGGRITFPFAKVRRRLVAEAPGDTLFEYFERIPELYARRAG